MHFICILSTINHKLAEASSKKTKEYKNYFEVFAKDRLKILETFQVKDSDSEIFKIGHTQSNDIISGLFISIIILFIFQDTNCIP